MMALRIPARGPLLMLLTLAVALPSAASTMAGAAAEACWKFVALIVDIVS
jgi:hypothetical protein